jgi:hypothetical protein
MHNVADHRRASTRNPVAGQPANPLLIVTFNRYLASRAAASHPGGRQFESGDRRGLNVVGVIQEIPRGSFRHSSPEVPEPTIIAGNPRPSPLMSPTGGGTLNTLQIGGFLR